MKKIILPIFLSLFLFSCITKTTNQTLPLPQTPVPTQTSENLTTSETTASGQIKTFTLEEISRHNNSSDCWLIIADKVYDVTDFINGHPGGKAILNGCGTDATTLFETRPTGSKTPHSENARIKRDKYFIGDLQNAD